MKQKILSSILFLTFSLCVLPFLSTEADALRDVITDTSSISGSDYTDSPALAEKLDAIFEGDAGVYYDYSCSSPVKTPLGSSPVKNNGIYMYASPVNDAAVDIGTSCWIYAQGVYHSLFGESTDGGNSEELYLNNTASRALTYGNLRAWGVRPMPGALIRASGHSMILLHYDADTITYVDGNGDGNGLVAVRICSWDRMGEYVEYIIQPESDHYAKLYGWGMCGDNLFWTVENDTLTITGSGVLQTPAWEEYNLSIENLTIQGDGLTIDDGVFCKLPNLKHIQFLDAAPTFSANAFLGVTAEVSYPAAKAGWAGDKLQNYGGRVTWEPYGMTDLKITSQPQSISVVAGSVAEVSVGAVGDGLTYHWYLKEPGESVYVKSSVSGPVYAMTIPALFDDLQVLCVLKDQYGNQVVSQSAHLRMGSHTPNVSSQTEPIAGSLDTPFFF